MQILSEYISLFFPKAIDGPYHGGFQKHPRFTIHLLVLTVGGFYNFSNRSELPNRSAKYLLFYTKVLSYVLHFQEKLVLPIGEVPGYIRFLPLFHWFWKWIRCLMLEINTSFLISLQKKYIFSKETLHISFTCKRKRIYTANS